MLQLELVEASNVVSADKLSEAWKYKSTNTGKSFSILIFESLSPVTSSFLWGSLQLPKTSGTEDAWWSDPLIPKGF